MSRFNYFLLCCAVIPEWVRTKDFQRRLFQLLALLLLFASSFFPVASSAAEYQIIDARSLDLSGISRPESASASGARAGAPDISALEVALGLGADSGLVELGTKTDRGGKSHTRFQQTYRGLPIWGEQVIVHTRPDNLVSYATGTVVQGLAASAPAPGSVQASGAASAAAALSESEALQLAKAAVGHLDPGWTFQNESIVRMIHLAAGQAPREVYSIDYFAEKEGSDPTRPYFLIDVYTGEIVDQWEGLTFGSAVGPGGNQKTGKYLFGTDHPPLDVYQLGTSCRMKNANVVTINLKHGTTGSTGHSFNCPENLVKEINGAYSPLNDAHFFGGLIFDMFNDWVGVAPLRFTLVMRVHYRTGYENAFWNGTSMTFGDGASKYYPFVDVNLSAHEVSHGFTQQNSGLFYRSESGGINEAFADITGEAAEFYWKGTVDWIVGAAITKNSAGLRFFRKPHLGWCLDRAFKGLPCWARRSLQQRYL